jgi:ribosomal protein L11 methyltransferase
MKAKIIPSMIPSVGHSESSQVSHEEILQCTWFLSASSAFALIEALEQAAEQGAFALQALTLFEGEERDLWHVQALCFSEKETPQTLGSILRETLGHFPPPENVTILPHMDWLKHSATKRPPLELGAFYIHEQEDPPSATARFSLCIEATTAFGSGHHETTQGCLALIQTLAKDAPWTRALDFGCGSGILTLAMNALCPGSAEGCDHDPESMRIARDNAILNDLPSVFYLGDAPAMVPYDLIVANLFANLLLDLAPVFSRNATQQLILSGLLREQTEDVVSRYASLGWQLQHTLSLNAWDSLWLKRRS